MINESPPSSPGCYMSSGDQMAQHMRILREISKQTPGQSLLQTNQRGMV